MQLHSQIKSIVQKFYLDKNQQSVPDLALSFQETRKEFKGDITLVVFPLTRFSGKNPEETAKELGEAIVANCQFFTEFNVVKGFLNISVDPAWYYGQIAHIQNNQKLEAKNESVVVEFSSPNTNKPLHLGHIRNNLLGDSVCKILDFAGIKVERVSLFNDRGIHICKSMLAWKLFGNGETPESSGLKGDHLIGKYYVIFDQENRKQAQILVESGMNEDEAKNKTELTAAAQEMLLKWEAGDEETIAIWKKMNDWVYEGFNQTYDRLGIRFDRFYYESQTYLLGKSIVEEGLDKGVFFKKEDGSVWIDLTAEGLDQKLVLRADGTSVYITQDLGTARERADEYQAQRYIYVVGNEQDYHFKVLRLILQKLGFAWADGIEHLSYGMIELPSGKMKSREGTVVDADDLIDEMVETARHRTKELGKIENLESEEAEKLYHTLGMGALRYFLLKVDPKKKMLFNPEESIDFQGNTGSFLQYTHARMAALGRRASEELREINFKEKSESIPLLINEVYANTPKYLAEQELSLIKCMMRFEGIVEEAAKTLSPALIANYTYELATVFNRFYHDLSIFKEENFKIRVLRLILVQKTQDTLQTALNLLGIDAPERM